MWFNLPKRSPQSALRYMKGDFEAPCPFACQTRQAASVREVCATQGSANLDYVVGDEPGFTRYHQPHGNAFRFVVVAVMQQVSHSDCRAES